MARNSFSRRILTINIAISICADRATRSAGLPATAIAASHFDYNNIANVTVDEPSNHAPANMAMAAGKQANTRSVPAPA